MDSHQCCRFRSQSAFSERHTLETQRKSQLHFINGEIAFGTHQNQCVFARLEHVLQRFLLAQFVLFITMADELLSWLLLHFLQERLEICHSVQYGFPCLVTLFHGRDEDFVDAFGLHHRPFRPPAMKKRQFVKTDFCRLFGKPFDSVHVLCGSHRQMQMRHPLPFLRQGLLDAVEATLLCRFGNSRTIECALSVHQHQFVTHAHAKHTNSVLSLLFRKFTNAGCVGNIEKTYLFHNFKSSIALWRVKSSSIFPFLRMQAGRWRQSPYRDT